MGTSVRSFLAIRIARPQVELLIRAQDRLRRSGADVKWVETTNLHLTLKFLGSVESERFDAVFQVAAAIAAGTPKMLGRLHGIGAFPRLLAPKVVWAGMTFLPDAARTLAARLDCELAPMGFATESRPFSGHVTLGRVRSPRGRKPLVEELQRMGGSDFGAQPVSSFELLRSDLSPAGPTYTILREFELSGERAGSP